MLNFNKVNWKYILVVLLVAVIAGTLVYSYRGVGEPLSDDQGPVSEKGIIQGSMSYPSEGIPDDVKVCAENVDTGERHCTQERIEDDKFKYGVGYQLELPAGNYYVEAIRTDYDGDYQAYYSEHVTCGLKQECDSHRPLIVKVEGGEKKENIDPIDWHKFGPENDLAEWKVYKNEEYDFQIRYPQQWEVKESKKGFNEVSFGERKEVDGKELFNSGLKVTYYEDHNKLPSPQGVDSLEDWIGKKYLPLKEGETKKSVKVGLNDYDATLVESYKSVGVTKLVTNHFLENEGIYRIQGHVSSMTTQYFPTEFDYEKVFDRMLSTFKLGVEETKEQVYKVNENLKLETVQPDMVLENPVLIKGEARGSWFFEASFPVKLVDANDKEVASASAQAQGDWMTEDFVSFKAELEFNQPETETGTLILKKANPSGLPENADQSEIPIKFE